MNNNKSVTYNYYIVEILYHESIVNLLTMIRVSTKMAKLKRGTFGRLYIGTTPFPKQYGYLYAEVMKLKTVQIELNEAESNRLDYDISKT